MGTLESGRTPLEGQMFSKTCLGRVFLYVRLKVLFSAKTYKLCTNFGNESDYLGVTVKTTGLPSEGPD